MILSHIGTELFANHKINQIKRYLLQDKLVLKKELRKWKGRFEAAKERVTELRILVNSSGVPARYKNSLGGSEGSSEWKKMPLKWSEMARAVDRLESEKVRELFRTLLQNHNN